MSRVAPLVSTKTPPAMRERLAASRARLFVGRQAPKKLFRQLIETNGALRVLYLYADGGMGKTTLLREYAQIAAEQCLPVVHLDARSLKPTAASVTATITELRQQSDLPESAPHVVFMDTFEQLSVLERWLREQWFPAQADAVRIVIASRTPPSLDWRTDPGWAESLRHYQLQYLDPDEAETYLSRRRLDVDMIQHGRNFAHGHPLALALYADAVTSDAHLADDEPPVYETLLPELLARLVGAAESMDRRHALYACAIARDLSEPLLSAMLQRDNCTDLFNWLRSLSFVEAGPRGLFPHPLLRDALLQDVKQRDPVLCLQLGERAYKRAVENIDAGQGDVRADVTDAVFLLRYTHLHLAWHRPDRNERAYVDAPVHSDWPALEAILRRHESSASTKRLNALAKVQPEALRVIRGADQTVIGFFLLLAIQELPTETIERDSVCAAFWAHCRAEGLASRSVSLLRFWMHRNCYMAPSIVDRLALTAAICDAMTSKRSYSGIIWPDTEDARELARCVGYRRIPGSEREISGYSTVVMGQDFRQRAATDWLRGLFRRVHGHDAASPARAPAPTAAVHPDDFSHAVHAALKHYLHPDRLADNPLCELISSSERNGNRLGPEAQTQALREALVNHCAQLGETPKTAIYQRVLERTYIKPARDQQAAAETLNLSYSTYRRRLREAVSLLQTELWQSLH